MQPLLACWHSRETELHRGISPFCCWHPGSYTSTVTSGRLRRTISRQQIGKMLCSGRNLLHCPWRQWVYRLRCLESMCLTIQRLVVRVRLAGTHLTSGIGPHAETEPGADVLYTVHDGVRLFRFSYLGRISDISSYSGTTPAVVRL